MSLLIARGRRKTYRRGWFGRAEGAVALDGVDLTILGEGLAAARVLGATCSSAITNGFGALSSPATCRSA